MQEKLQEINRNLERLLRNFQAIKSENDILKNQLEAQRKSAHEKNNTIDALEKQVQLIKTVQNIAGNEQEGDASDGKTEMKKKINELIKEVDNCIALLND